QNGVLIRMALFALTLDVADKVEQYEVDVPWFSRKRNS
ncbi:MAG: aspartate carbamoyltransferase, partial [Pseudomonadota bacterium]|nr:aspartate carbamoyltransferase [Pseudomonadota bacterium]